MSNFINAAKAALKEQFWGLAAPVMVGAVCIAIIRAVLNK